ncbi:MAG: hypothetical protein ABUT39_29705 [Acidobacteriota bacterium]
MQAGSRWLSGLAVVALAAGMAVPAGATTLLRRSLDELVAGNRTIVVGEVVEARSYWNQNHTFILTDVRIKADDVLKGRLPGREVTVTLMGGRVGDLTTLIVGGPELVPGRSYVLFLGRGNLPGAAGALTVRDFSQGVFEVKVAADGLRAVSQASDQPLVPDARGSFDAPGGREGLQLGTMFRSIRDIEAGRSRQEVQ